MGSLNFRLILTLDMGGDNMITGMLHRIWFRYFLSNERGVRMKKFTALLLSGVLLLLATGCTPKTDAGDATVPTPENPELILATTTSTQDSGLLDYLLPIFTEDTGYTVKTIAVGTGKAIQMGRDGEADVLLVHAKSDELKFVEEGHGLERHDVMYNDFILVGPKDDALKLKEQFGNDIAGGLRAIADVQATFVSRGDDSGTHKKEIAIWKSADLEPVGDWYLSAGSGMADVLKIADEKQAYTITDRATYLSMKSDLDLEIAIEGDENLFNQYGVIPVNPEKGETINNEGAVAFMEWILSEKGQNLIKEFGVQEYGQPLFIPNGN